MSEKNLEQSLRNAIALMAKEKDSCTTTSPGVAERND